MMAPMARAATTSDVFNAISDVFDPTAGYNDIVHGSSFVMVTEFDGDECPNDRSILTYSESDDPTSKHYTDQTEMFSKKKWVDPPFCPNESMLVNRSRRF